MFIMMSRLIYSEFRPSNYCSSDCLRVADENGTLEPSCLVTRRVVLPATSSTVEIFSFMSKLLEFVAACAVVISLCSFE